MALEEIPQGVIGNMGDNTLPDQVGAMKLLANC